LIIGYQISPKRIQNANEQEPFGGWEMGANTVRLAAKLEKNGQLENIKTRRHLPAAYSNIFE
jgi:hypothetical protein